MSAVAFAPVGVPQAVLDLQVRSLGTDEDREAWLEARRYVITATEAKSLIMADLSGNPTSVKRAIDDLIKEKLEGSTFFGNHFTEWGKMREPVILAELERRYGMTGCGLLVHAEVNSRHAATPDGAGVNFDGLLELTEIKTSKNDVTYGSTGFQKAGYLFQMLWQMYCTGAGRVLYVVEKHDNDWLGWDLRDRSTWRLEDGPRVFPIAAIWVVRDEPLIARMIQLADQALDALDAARAAQAAAVGVEVVEAVEDPLLVELIDRVVLARKDEAAAAAVKTSAWKQLLAFGDERGDFTGSSLLGSVKFVAPASAEVEVVDVEAAKAAHPKEFAQLERAKKRAADLAASWSALAGLHVCKETRVGKPSLTVTAVKKGKK